MNKIITTGLIMLCTGAGFAQPTEAMMAPIKALFKGMKDGDSALVHSGFVDQVTFVSVLKGKDGKPILRADDFSGFLKAVGTPHAESWNEPIWDVQAQVDGNFAQVWAKYAFYLGKNFLHCGVDAFHLFKDENGKWKIFHLADTRTKDGCVIPKEISDQYK